MIGCNVFYLLILILLASLESWLRDGQDGEAKIQCAVWLFFVGRTMVVVLSTGICLYVMEKVTLPETPPKPEAATSDNTG